MFRKGPSLYAFKGLAGRLGPIGVHASMLAIMAGVAIGGLGGFRGSVMVPQGGDFLMAEVSVPTHSKVPAVPVFATVMLMPACLPSWQGFPLGALGGGSEVTVPKFPEAVSPHVPPAVIGHASNHKGFACGG